MSLLSENEASDNRLKSALIYRAMEAIRRSHVMSEEKQSIMSLNHAGAISEETLLSFLDAEKETSAEIFDIQSEAELIKEGI